MEPFIIEGHPIQGSASIGFALYPEHGATKDSLLNAADAAMYKIKNDKKQSAQMAGGRVNAEYAELGSRD